MADASKFIIFQIVKLIPARLKRRLSWLFLYMLILACAETVVVGMIAFYAAAVSDPVSTARLPLILKLKQLPFFADILSSPKAIISVLSLAVILVLPIKNVFRGFVTYRIARCSASMESYFGQRLLEVLLAKDYMWHLKQNTADLVQYVNWRNHLGRNFVSPHLKIVCEVVMLSVLLLGLMVAQPVVSTLFVFFQGGAGFIIFRLLKKGLDESATGCRNSELAMSRYATRAIHAIKDVKITGTEPSFISSFSLYSSRFAKLFGKQQFWRESPLLVLETFGFIVIACAILFMMYVLDYSPLNITGTTALLAVTGWRTLPSFNRILAALTTVRTSRPYVVKILDELHNDLNSKETFSDNISPISFVGELKFDKVSFGYSEEDKVVKDFSLVIKKGQSVGIMGPSGCGKSTVTDLLCGLLWPDKGHVYIDKQQLNKRNVVRWHKLLGYVPQSPYIFDATLAENIAFGIPVEKIDMEKIKICCAKASINFLHRLPQGAMTQIGERGVRLSGGQRQRVAIARALYRDPSVLIFDEATSALDEKTDSEISSLLIKIKGEITLIIVTHRKSSVESCDIILNMNELI
nr:ABC transporter ATP-binding protein [uncultured Desulfuromonas sp.]